MTGRYVGLWQGGLCAWAHTVPVQRVHGRSAARGAAMTLDDVMRCGRTFEDYARVVSVL